MITKDNLRLLLTTVLGFETKDGNKYIHKYGNDTSIEVDFDKKNITYAPVDKNFHNAEYPTKENPATGFVIHRDTTLNFKQNENFVCLVCVHMLLTKGYKAQHIVFEPSFTVGHVNKPSYGDILVFDKEYKPFVLIENKTYGSEFSKEWSLMQRTGGQLFSYLGPLTNKMPLCQSIILFAADYETGKLIHKNHIITLLDNEKRIEELENPKTFATTQGQYFDVWSETYAKSFDTVGLFEKEIETYTIGKHKYTIDDLNPLTHAEIKPLYNEFATILRNHAITDFEHSFYILIDLFLCKIADERNNPNDLQFHYKGITRDTPKEYCGRLLKLYQQGKKDLFDIIVINKEEEDITELFERNGYKINGLFADIKKMFDQLKYYNIKKFNFISVENQEDFETNFQILIKVASLIQDINLSDSETNHFFGTLFEGLLSKNVHQTEGQFFTPLPIVNFIIRCLPKFANPDKVRLLDYACGAGHFLIEPSRLYPNIKLYGIEKSQSLSQVAKIATIINGCNDSHIVYKDTLSTIDSRDVRYQGFEQESFDCIIANPPYSVKGFLETLTETDRQQFELIKAIEEKSYASNKTIESFFIERAKYFLKDGGIFGIVLPSSILSNNSSLDVRTRELLFAHFNLLAVAEMNSRTFGSTSTNTIILFAQKVEKKNVENLVKAFLINDHVEKRDKYEAIIEYCQKQEFDLSDYCAFMQEGLLNSSLKDSAVFKEYRHAFKPQNVSTATKREWFEKSSFFLADKSPRSKENNQKFKEYTESIEYKELENTEIEKQFVNYVKPIEVDKLSTFIQVYDNIIAVLQSPPDKVNGNSNKAAIVSFLGYGWSKRKGDEGIRYITDQVVIPQKEDDEEDDKDAEILEAINSIQYIKTPLYSPYVDNDPSKFSYAIRRHIMKSCRKFSFATEACNGMEPTLGDMSELISSTPLHDMLDFSGAEFNKVIRTHIIKSRTISSQYTLKSLSEIASYVTQRISYTPDMLSVYISTDNMLKDLAGVIEYDGVPNINSGIRYLRGDILVSNIRPYLKKIWYADKDGICSPDVLVFRIINDEEILSKYLYYILSQDIFFDFMMDHKKGLKMPRGNKDEIKKFKIPTPLPKIQQQIIDECEKVDNEYKRSRMAIEEYRKRIVQVFENLKVIGGGGGKIGRIKDFGDVKMCKRIMKYQTSTSGDIPFYKIGTFGSEADAYINRSLYEEYRTKYPYPQKGQVLLSAAGTLGRTVLFNGEDAYFQDSNIVWIDNNEQKVLNPFLYYCFKYFVNWTEYKTDGPVISRLYNNDVRAISIPIPTLEQQQDIVTEIKGYETKIAESKAIITASAARKQAILDKYLK